MPTPEDTRAEPAQVGDERTLLEGFLDFHRGTFRWKCAGLTDEQLRARSVPPSAMSLLGLVRHLTDVERAWFLRGVGGSDAEALYWTDADTDADFHDVDTVSVADAWAAYERTVAESKAVAAGVALDTTFTRKRNGETYSLRWLYLHMIEEYARHNGHADLLRERIDGATGE